MNIQEIVRLSEILGEMGRVKRATELPSGEAESDSHHSFSLALVAYHIVKKECPELDADKVMLFALVHDLLEIITGDEDTLHYTAEEHVAKQQREEQAVAEFDEIFTNYPELKAAMHEYEKLDTPEAATVFVLDKACTTWTWLHHSNMKHHAVARGITKKSDVDAWTIRQQLKFAKRLKAKAPQAVMSIYADSFDAMRRLYSE